MQKICFVCTGNTCRSPVAEKLFSKYLKMANITEIKVCSCGLSVQKGDSISKNSILVLKERGITVRSRKAKQLTKSMLSKYDLFITMTKAQKNEFSKKDNVFSFGELVCGEDIIDPYGGSIQDYENMAKQIEDYSKILVKKLSDIKGEH